jgi:hypothetical protein
MNPLQIEYFLTYESEGKECITKSVSSLGVLTDLMSFYKLNIGVHNIRVFKREIIEYELDISKL